jgi:hypothetical protein
MRIIDVQQGTPEFFRARMGIVTASHADQIITPVKAELSNASRKYAYKLVAERLLNEPMTTGVETDWMARGKELEPLAVKQFEWVNEIQTEPVGFIVTNDGLVGASPDRLIKGQNAGLEIKSPAPHTHIGYLLDGPGEAYRPQVMTQMYVAEFDSVTFYSYSDRMPAATIRTNRDEIYIAKLKDALDQFNAQLFEMLDRAKSLGVFQAFDSALTPTDVERSEELNRQFREDFGLSSFGESS